MEVQRRLTTVRHKLRVLYRRRDLEHFDAIDELAEDFRVAYANEIMLEAYMVGPERDDMPKDYGWNWKSALRGDVRTMLDGVEKLIASFREWSDQQLHA